MGAGCWGLRAWGPDLGRTRRPPPSPLEPSPHSSPPVGAGRARKAGAARPARVRGLFPRVRQEALPPAENQFVLHFLCPGPAARPPGGAGRSGAGRAAVRADCVSQNVSPRPAAARVPRPARRSARVQLGRGRGGLGAPSSVPSEVQAGGEGRGRWAQPGPRVPPEAPLVPTRRAAGVLGAGGGGRGAGAAARRLRVEEVLPPSGWAVRQGRCGGRSCRPGA